jgi:hypothetical protein
MCKGAIVESFEVLYQHLHGETEETQEIPQDTSIWCPGRLLSTIIVASGNFLFVHNILLLYLHFEIHVSNCI